MNTLIDQALQGGKYSLDKELKRDSFSVTFQATQHHLGQAVLIKTLNEAAQQAPNFAEHRRTFQAEAQRLAMCVHPNIAKIQDVFVEDDLPYLVMDCIPGQTLHDIVFPNRPLPEAIAIWYIRQIGEALNVIHQQGLLHRDITPNHIVIHPKTQAAVLIDFGLALECVSDSTDTETLLINPGGYAPIERYLAQDRLTPATDVYGLAATLYTLLTAKSPVTSILRDRQPLPPPCHFRPELSSDVNQAVLIGMALERCDRPSTVAEWLSLLPNAETTLLSTPNPGSMRSPSTPRSQIAASRRRPRFRPQGTPATPQLMAGIVPTTGLDRRWLTSGAMVFGVVLTLVATAGLLLKLYSPKQTAPLPATSPTRDAGGVPFWQELGIPALKQQSPTLTEPSVPNTAIDVLDDPISQPLQPLIDLAPIPELLLEELPPSQENLNPSYSEDLTPASSDASPAKTAPKIVDEWQAPSSPPQELSQPVEDSALPASEDLNVDSTPPVEATPAPDPYSNLLQTPTSPQEVSPGPLEPLPENPDVSPENLEVPPESE